MRAPTMLTSAGTILGLCVAAATAAAQRGAVSDFSGASVASSALLGPFVHRAGTSAATFALVNAAVGEMGSKLGVSLEAGTVQGGGLITSGRGVQALGRLVSGSTTPTAAAREAVARALRPSGASAAQVDRLVSALAGLLMNAPASPGSASTGRGRVELPSEPPAVESAGGPDDGPAQERNAAATRVSPVAARRTQRLSIAAIQEAAAAFDDLVDSASAAYLGNPPEEFRAVYSSLYELRCAESAAAGVTVAMCAPPAFVIDQPPPRPLINQDSIDAAERTRAAAAAAAAAQARVDSIAAAAARAHADSVIAAERAVETVRARAVLETRIFFDINQFSLDPDAKAVLAAKLRVLQANPEVRIRVEGNVDQGESTAFNHLLGRFRAEQARSYLIAHGVNVNRIDVVDNGASHPVCSQRRESCASQNRRDEFKIVAGGAQMRLPE